MNGIEDTGIQISVVRADMVANMPYEGESKIEISPASDERKTTSLEIFEMKINDNLHGDVSVNCAVSRRLSHDLSIRFFVYTVLQKNIELHGSSYFLETSVLELKVLNHSELIVPNEGVAVLGISHHPKERSVIIIDSSLKSVQSTERSLSSELQHDLRCELSLTDRQEIDQLDDGFRKLMHETKETLYEGRRFEAEKNKLKNLLNIHLCIRKELEATLQETSTEGRKRKTNNNKVELLVTKNKIQGINKHCKDLEQKFEKLNSKQKNTQKELTHWKV
ncbi:retrovirus-related Pol polyprotein from transposon opus [Nephila pilipes]|uniref:Retrovirus-related Pol polyprotein from transposon opus n=1 Tax=Nephila pilipes TaxID=299642 RepID=A0A8X6Q1E6_NEPPI|nr:retrovirus-related Pol polyprotein from transposon opus [Nephila pilipes]